MIQPPNKVSGFQGMQEASTGFDRVRLQRWIPDNKDKSSLNDLLKLNTKPKADIALFLTRVENATQFDKKELKEVVYRILESLMEGTDMKFVTNRIESFCERCREFNQQNLSQFLIRELNIAEGKSIEIWQALKMPLSFTQIVDQMTNRNLNKNLTNYFHSNNLTIDNVIPPENENQYMGADLAVRKMLKLPPLISYKDQVIDPLTIEQKQDIIKKIKELLPIELRFYFLSDICLREDYKEKESEIKELYDQKIKDKPNISQYEKDLLVVEYNTKIYELALDIAKKIVNHVFEDRGNNEDIFDGLKGMGS